jgi:hypothetical protein
MFGVSYASCGPTIRGGGWKGSGQGVVVPLSTMAWSHSCHASSFISLYKQQLSFTRKEDYNGWFTVYTYNEGNSVPKGLKLVQQTMKHICTIAWQPSLVLSGLGRARLVPIAC